MSVSGSTLAGMLAHLESAPQGWLGRTQTASVSDQREALAPTGVDLLDTRWPQCRATAQLDETFCEECGAAAGVSAPRPSSTDQPRLLQKDDAIPATEVNRRRTQDRYSAVRRCQGLEGISEGLADFEWNR